MSRLRARWHVVVFLLALGASAPAAETNAPSRLDYSTFRVIAEKNIFNAGRSGGRSSGSRTDTRRPSRVDSVSLVGTMSYEKGRFAFFDGSSSEYRKVLQAGATIASHKIRDISSAGVTLEHEGKVLELKVNSQLRREEDGPWQVASRTESASRSESSSRSESNTSTRSGGGDAASASPSRSSTGPAASSSEAEISEALKRLMQKREEENK